MRLSSIRVSKRPSTGWGAGGRSLRDALGGRLRTADGRRVGIHRAEARVVLGKSERELLQRLADEGKPSRLAAGDMLIAKSLETDGLLFMVQNTGCAIITPKGRHVLAAIEPPKPPSKKRSASWARRTVP